MENSKDIERKGCIGIVAMLLLPLAFFFRAFVASCLWAWFFIPAGAPQLPNTAFMGLFLLLPLFYSRKGIDAKVLTPKEFAYKTFSTLFLDPAITLLLGYIVWKVAS